MEDNTKQVTIYGRKTCMPCRKLRYLLEQDGTPYNYIDVDTISMREYNEVIKATGVMTPPQVKVGDKIVATGDINTVRRLLDT